MWREDGKEVRAEGACLPGVREHGISQHRPDGNGGRLLITKYADRSLPQWVLISGFVEAGETLEEAAEREVYEETGIRIWNLQHFGSQPWGAPAP